MIYKGSTELNLYSFPASQTSASLAGYTGGSYTALVEQLPSNGGGPSYPGAANVVLPPGYQIWENKGIYLGSNHEGVWSSLPGAAHFGVSATNANGTPVNGGTGNDGALWTETGDSNPYHSLGGQFVAAPVILREAGTNAQNLYIGIGADHAAWVTDDTHSWKSLTPGFYCNDVGAANWTKYNALQLTCLGPNGTVYFGYAQIINGQLPTLAGPLVAEGLNLSGLATSTAVAVVNNHLTLYATASGGQVYQLPTGQSQWTTAVNWKCVGHPSFASTPTDGLTYMGCHGLDGHAWYDYNSGSDWHGAISLAGNVTGTLGIETGPDGVANVYAEGTNPVP